MFFLNFFKKRIDHIFYSKVIQDYILRNYVRGVNSSSTRVYIIPWEKTFWRRVVMDVFQKPEA